MSNPGKVEFKVISRTYKEVFEEDVNYWLERGWLLSGIMQNPVVGGTLYWNITLIKPIETE